MFGICLDDLKLDMFVSLLSLYQSAADIELYPEDEYPTIEEIKKDLQEKLSWIDLQLTHQNHIDLVFKTRVYGTSPPEKQPEITNRLRIHLVGRRENNGIWDKLIAFEFPDIGVERRNILTEQVEDLLIDSCQACIVTEREQLTKNL